MRPAGVAFLILTVSAGGQDFDEVIRPLLEEQCLSCHSDANPLGGLSIETAEAASRGGAGGPAIVAEDPDGSPLLARMALAEGEPGAMPPAGPRVSADLMAAVRTWIEQGAPWTGSLMPPDPVTTEITNAEELELVRTIRARIASRGADSVEPGSAYDEAVPTTNVALQMMPIPEGEFLMGTPPDEEGRNADEGPQRRVQLEAFWMSAHEVGWDAFRPFMLREADTYIDPDGTAAAVSSPTPPYVEMSFGMGISGYPAISMTQHAASKYAQWLSAKTGRFYRLPTEAEWEYACRAGTETAYSFGNDPSALAQHGWFGGNSGYQYKELGAMAPNDWGLHDMHGNVWEWTLDRYDETYPSAEAVLISPWARAERLYPRVVRGGSWLDTPASLRCGARRASTDDWKVQDPQLPKSIWYHTDAPWLGFRLVRSVRLPSAEEMYAYWNSATGRK